MTKALINPQEMQLWERLLMPWTTILKFQEDLVQLKKRAKINRASTQVFQPQDSRPFKQKSRPSCQPSTQVLKLSNSCLASPPPSWKGHVDICQGASLHRINPTTYSSSNFSLQYPAMRGTMDLIRLVEPTFSKSGLWDTVPSMQGKKKKHWEVSGKSRMTFSQGAS